MSNYSYVAVDPQGMESRGTLYVSDQSEALRRIKEMGSFPTKVRRQPANPAILWPPRTRTREQPAGDGTCQFRCGVGA